MKLTDEKGRLFGKINLVDLGIILLIILAFCAVGAKLVKERTVDRETVVIDYTLSVKGVRQQSVDAISMETKDITDAEKDEPLGDIINIEKRPAEELIALEDGTFKWGEYRDKYDLYITVEAKGIKTADGYFTESGKKLLYGSTIGLNNGYSQMFGTIEKIEVVQ